MALKPTIKPSFLKDSDDAEQAEQPPVVTEEIEELPETLAIKNIGSSTIFLESGRVDPQMDGVATRAEYQNFSYILEKVKG